MANLTFRAVNPQGHVSDLVLQARSSTTLELQNASYNDVKVRPSKIYVQNAGNASAIILTFNDGTVRMVPEKTNTYIDCISFLNVKIENSGLSQTILFIFDEAGYNNSYGTVSAQSTISFGNINDFLLGFDQTGAFSATVNEGVEKVYSSNVSTSSFTKDTTLARFGLGSAKAATLSSVFYFQNFNFFELEKPFTLDFWLYTPPTVISGDFTILSFTNSASGSVPALQELSIVQGATFPPCQIGINQFGNVDASQNIVINSNTWDFIKLVSDGTRLYLYVNGVLVINTAKVSANSMSYLRVGAGRGGNTGVLCNYDEIRYSKGWADPNPTVIPTAAYIR